MPNPNSNLVLAGTSAGGSTGLELLSVAPTGTTGPTNATTALTAVNAAWDGMGYVSTDGITISADESSNEIGAYGTGIPVRVVNTKSAETFQVVCLETNLAVLEVYNRKELGTIQPDANGAFSFSRGTVLVQRYSFVLDIVDGENLIRLWYPEAEVKERTERKIGNGEGISYGFTIQAYPSDALNGDFVKDFYRIPELASS
jgi:hypothetical protein